jgi:hypothetical protein
LPAAGGQRQHELCPWDVEQATRADGLANAAVRADGQVAFTLHSGVIGEMTSTAAGLYLGPQDSVAGALRVLRLLDRPAGALSVWGDLIDPIWVSDNELLTVAGARFLPNASSVCSPLQCFGEFVPYDLSRTALRDTIALGYELARIRIVDGAATVVQTRPIPETVAWSYDASVGVAHVVSQSIRPFDDFVHESIADTVYALHPGGGEPNVVYGTTRLVAGRYLERVHAIASGHGRIFLSRSWQAESLATAQTIPNSAVPTSEISELLSDGSLRTVAPAVSFRWGRLRLSPDGRHLYAEALSRSSSDLYRIEVLP